MPALGGKGLLKSSLNKAATRVNTDLVRAATEDWSRRLRACTHSRENI